MSLEVVESTKMQEDGRWITFRLQIWNAEWFQVIFMQNLLIWTSDALWEFASFPVMRVFGHLTSTFFLGFCCKGSSTTATFVRKLNLKLWREKSETSRKNQGQGGHQPLTPRTSEMVRPGDDLGSWGNVWEDRWMMYGSRHVCRQFIHIDGDQQQNIFDFWVEAPYSQSIPCIEQDASQPHPHCKCHSIHLVPITSGETPFLQKSKPSKTILQNHQKHDMGCERWHGPLWSFQKTSIELQLSVLCRGLHYPLGLVQGR